MALRMMGVFCRGRGNGQDFGCIHRPCHALVPRGGHRRDGEQRCGHHRSMVIALLIGPNVVLSVATTLGDTTLARHAI
jgi:hypothetical protein